ncbi:hypothetical protein NEOLEDRAFT_1151875 [Neolentinus lepideus HHB14362 ss-1]|uniref:Uncharacterized protein n=1 Tax=Neolentinus lepideus HHB14362 ss-1 TaxID=1314782 RepID=A0A165NFE8_9AGAM|nr:hypothetical protein NEOLEDRAFT_1151875 [Neolentinus lepideus HHB14362 ss-1]
MASPRGSYDRGLLASAPVATRADRQGGYDVDLLENDPYSGRLLHSSSRLALSTPPSPAQTEQGLPFKEERVLTASSKARKPFWRTGKGTTIIPIAAIVILGAVIGGAVGGTVKKHKSSNAMTASSAPAQSYSSSSSPSSTSTAPEGSGNASIVSAPQSGAPIASNAQIGSPIGGQFASDVAVTTIPTASVSPGSGVQAFAVDP